MTKKHQELYFHIRDDLFKNYNTGYTRVELHELIKQCVLPMLYDEDSCWHLPDRSSVKSLTEHGWILFIEQVKSWAMENYSYIHNYKSK